MTLKLKTLRLALKLKTRETLQKSMSATNAVKEYVFEKGPWGALGYLDTRQAVSPKTQA